ncbi:MAG: hypothetical protein AB7J28_15875 [Hyphomonadaceae bacterium]
MSRAYFWIRVIRQGERVFYVDSIGPRVMPESDRTYIGPFQTKRERDARLAELKAA